MKTKSSPYRNPAPADAKPIGYSPVYSVSGSGGVASTEPVTLSPNSGRILAASVALFMLSVGLLTLTAYRTQSMNARIEAAKIEARNAGIEQGLKDGSAQAKRQRHAAKTAIDACVKGALN